jgi:transcriptional regulator with XRE-family HTH domain
MNSAPQDLKAALETKGISQIRLAMGTGIHPSTISRYVAGLKPTDAHAAKIAEALRARGGES